MEKGKVGVEVESDQEFHFGHMDSFSKHPDGGVKWTVVYSSWVYLRERCGWRCKFGSHVLWLVSNASGPLSGECRAGFLSQWTNTTGILGQNSLGVGVLMHLRCLATSLAGATSLTSCLSVQALPNVPWVWARVGGVRGIALPGNHWYREVVQGLT